MTAHQNPPTEHSSFFAPKQFEATFRHQGKPYELTLQTPDLRDARVGVWADWGPMYTVKVNPNQTTTLTCRCPESGQQSHVEFNPIQVEVNSPANWKRREERPFYIQLVAPSLGLRIKAYMDPSGNVAETEVCPLANDLPVSALLFQEPPRIRVSRPHEDTENHRTL